MDDDKRKNIVVGVLSLMSLPFGIWLIYQYFYAEPGQIDSFNLDIHPATCYLDPVGDVVLQIPITQVDEVDEISKITLVEPENLTVTRAGLLDAGRGPQDELASEDLSALTVGENDWYWLGGVSPVGQTLVLVLDTPKPGIASAEAIRIGVNPGETRWRDDLPLRIEVGAGQCTVAVRAEPPPGPQECGRSVPCPTSPVS